MLDHAKLEALRTAALSDDWAMAGELYIELSLETRGTNDRPRVEAIAPALRLLDGEALAAVVDELLASAA